MLRAKIIMFDKSRRYKHKLLVFAIRKTSTLDVAAYV